MKMPGRDGLWLLENLRERDPGQTSVIMLTGYGDASPRWTVCAGARWTIC